jgi:hypothetical protein
MLFPKSGSLARGAFSVFDVVIDIALDRFTCFGEPPWGIGPIKITEASTVSRNIRGFAEALGERVALFIHKAAHRLAKDQGCCGVKSVAEEEGLEIDNAFRFTEDADHIVYVLSKCAQVLILHSNELTS